MDVNIVQTSEEDYELWVMGNKVGDAVLHFFGSEAYISNIDIYRNIQNRGIGRRVVQHIKQLPHINIITGEAPLDALQFWVKMGAVVNTEDLNNATDDSDDLIRFKIFC